MPGGLVFCGAGNRNRTRNPLITKIKNRRSEGVFIYKYDQKQPPNIQLAIYTFI